MGMNWGVKRDHQDAERRRWLLWELGLHPAGWLMQPQEMCTRTAHPGLSVSRCPLAQARWLVKGGSRSS